MTATSYEGTLAEENVLLTVYDGITYNTKLSTPLVVQLLPAADVDADYNATISGRTITINWAGADQTNFFVTIKGRL